jgi:PE family/PE-PPE domain
MPATIATAARDLTNIGSSLSAANSAAAVSTTAVIAAAGDEVSAAIASLFGSYTRQYEALLNHAAAFHEEFAATLASAGSAYAQAEAANATAISDGLGRLTAPIGSLLGGPPTTPTPSAPAPTPMVMSPLQGPTIALIMGGTGPPTFSPSYVTAAVNFLDQHFAVLSANAQTLPAPEELYPVTPGIGIKSLTLDQSVSQGVQILDNAIKQQLATPGVNSVAVLGYSQSAVISSLEMENLANPALNPHTRRPPINSASPCWVTQ